MMERSISRWDCFVFHFYFCWFRMERSSRKSHHVVRSYIDVVCLCWFKEPLGIANGTYSMDLRWRDGFCFQRVVSTWTDEADPNPIQMNRWSSSVFMRRYSRSWQLATSVNVPTSSSFPVINFPHDSGDPNYQTASSKKSLLGHH